MAFTSSPTVLSTATKAPDRVTQHNSASVFHPSVWGDHFLGYTSAELEVDINMKRTHQQLKEKLRKRLVEATDKPSEQLDLIDAIQRLGVAYHFETEIDQSLHQIHETYHQSAHESVNYNEDLYTLSLSFRLLRQQGYHVSCDVFNKLKDKEGKFKKSLISDVKGMLSLYEATHLSVHQEDILDEALEFTTTNLKSALPKLSINDPIAAQVVVHALNQPIHKGLTRLESRQYISIYEKDDSHSKVLLDFAKLDFNLVQKLHQRELSEFTRWWKDLDVAQKLPFARDRAVELFFWILGVYYEPQYCLAIRILSKVIALISILDDLYDASPATIQELVIFHDAIQRWEVSAPDQLPDFMKHFYQKILDTYKSFDDEMAKQGRSYRVDYARSAFKDMARGYLAEAKWYNDGYVPSLVEYMRVGELTSGLRSLSTVSFVGMGELVTKAAFDWIRNDPLIVQASAAIGRLLDDVAGHEFEQERGHAASAVECYMKQYGATRKEAVAEFHKRVTNACKDINSECLCPTKVPMPLLLRVVNLARTFHFVYKDGTDCYTHSDTKLKKILTLVLVEPVPI